MTQLKFQWPAIFPVLVGSVSSLECLDAPAVLGITMHRETQGWWLSVRFWLHEIIILLPLELGRPTVQEDGGDIIFKVCTGIVADYCLNPLSPNIHIQILQTDLRTFSLIKNKLREFDKRSKIFLFVIIWLILIDFALDNLWILLGENWCWSLLGRECLIPHKCTYILLINCLQMYFLGVIMPFLNWNSHFSPYTNLCWFKTIAPHRSKSPSSHIVYRSISQQRRHILGGRRLLVYVGIVGVAIFDFVTEEDCEE